MEVIPNKEILVAELKSLLLNAYHRKGLDTNEKVIKKSTELKAKYKNYHDYEMYHLLVSSGLLYPTENFDFPGEDSVENFIRSL